jgi:hypothetical protein
VKPILDVVNETNPINVCVNLFSLNNLVLILKQTSCLIRLINLLVKN